MSKYKSFHKYKPFVISDPVDHSMGSALRQYVEIKIHHLIKQSDFKEIRVVGEYDRGCSISQFEKNDKITNWQRPTAEILDDTLYLKCFPGFDYVKHYSSLVASYLAMNGRDYSQVSYSLPSDQSCWNAVNSLGLNTIPKSDIIVLGYGLPIIAQTDLWNGNESILWTSKKIGKKTVTFLIVQFSYWGDILRRIMNVLASAGFDTAIFTAKVGGINDKLNPNIDIVTGNSTLLDGELIRWENIFDLPESEVVHGHHINSSSVMSEVPAWVDNVKMFDFVDSEIGEFAKGAMESQMRFGYLHYISNLLSRQNSENLSNERTSTILGKREIIKLKIRKYIEKTILDLN